MLKVRVKCPYPLLKNLPTDAGWDLRSMETIEVMPGDCITVSTGCQINMRHNGPSPMQYFKTTHACYDFLAPHGLEVQVRGRSSMAKKGFITHLGTVDETYHSDIKVTMIYLGKEPYTIQQGNAIAQLVFTTFLPVETIEVSEMEEDRGGYGSSGL